MTIFHVVTKTFIIIIICDGLCMKHASIYLYTYIYTYFWKEYSIELPTKKGAYRAVLLVINLEREHHLLVCVVNALQNHRGKSFLHYNTHIYTHFISKFYLLPKIGMRLHTYSRRISFQLYSVYNIIIMWSLLFLVWYSFIYPLDSVI